MVPATLPEVIQILSNVLILGDFIIYHLGQLFQTIMVKNIFYGANNNLFNVPNEHHKICDVANYYFDSIYCVPKH